MAIQPLSRSIKSENGHLRILVIDDAREICDFVVDYVLVPNGYEPIIARDGAEGLRKALQESPDLILLDYEMPKMNGLQVLEKLHANQSQIPVILMTSHGSEQIAVQVFRLGVRDYIIKPFAVDQMLGAIQQAMTEARLRREKQALTARLLQSNRKLSQHLRELGVLYRIGKTVTKLMPLDVLLERTADAALYITGAQACTLLLNDPASGQLQPQVVKQRRQKTTSVSVSPAEIELARAAVASGGVATANWTLYVPLQVGAKTLGALGVNNRAADNTPRPFGDHDEQLLRTLADYTAIAIENARLLQQVDKGRQPGQIQGLFEGHVAPSVVERLMGQAGKIKLEGTQQTVSLLLADIRGISHFSSKVTPDVLVKVLNHHIQIATDAILAEQGTLDKFLGDAVVAFFNAPLPQPDHALRAVRAGLAIHRALQTYHQDLPTAYRLQFGIGISTGEAVVGNIGAPQLLNYTVIGEPVNTGKRLQERAAGGQIVICRNTHDLVRDHVLVRPLGTNELKGLPPHHAFEAIDLRVDKSSP